jgi:predicted nucleic acid-binding protein
MRWLAVCDDDVFVSVLSLGEIHKGIAQLRDNVRAEELRHWFEKDLMRRFGERVLPVSAEIASVWGGISGEAERRGVCIPAVDGLIGATALTHNLTVVTRNIADIAATGARTFCPWAKM